MHAQSGNVIIFSVCLSVHAKSPDLTIEVKNLHMYQYVQAECLKQRNHLFIAYMHLSHSNRELEKSFFIIVYTHVFTCAAMT